ncbi:MAG: hypothetical protein EZS28_025901 [Streblomastix strix]|uniref:Uncharacterized protein n=1 Tax=Streblomastix strix TaxID=222440 RepID=A0A5J4V7V4_9EUKA|nr:MAG: hypothetical protein EZS28_025901 [Streblomastix strix]
MPIKADLKQQEDIRQFYLISEIKYELNIQWHVIEGIFKFSGVVKQLCRVGGFTSSYLYGAATAYCRGLRLDQHYDTGRWPYLTPDTEEKVDIMQKMYTMRCHEFDHSRRIATTMKLHPVYEKFDIEIDIPAQSTVSQFLQRHKIVLSTTQILTPARNDAATVSNITYWFSDPLTVEFVNQFTLEANFNADEIHIDLSSKVKIAKEKGARRVPTETDDNFANFISMMETISPGHRSPVPFFIVGGPANVPKEIEQFNQQIQASIHVNCSGIMTLNMFDECEDYFCDHVKHQKEI